MSELVLRSAYLDRNGQKVTVLSYPKRGEVEYVHPDVQSRRTSMAAELGLVAAGATFVAQRDLRPPQEREELTRQLRALSKVAAPKAREEAHGHMLRCVASANIGNVQPVNLADFPRTWVQGEQPGLTLGRNANQVRACDQALDTTWDSADVQAARRINFDEEGNPRETQGVSLTTQAELRLDSLAGLGSAIAQAAGDRFGELADRVREKFRR